MNKNLLKITSRLLGLIFIFNICLIWPAQAATGTPASIIDPTASAYQSGNYQLNDFTLLAIRISQMILGIVGSLALVMFVYGGFMFLISSGSSEKIKTAQNILVAAVIGLIIVFASYLIIQTALKAIGLSWDGGLLKIK
ncbi:MAG: hypothetical protein WC863_03550 [Patescibacteria group bacterium]